MKSYHETESQIGVEQGPYWVQMDTIFMEASLPSPISSAFSLPVIGLWSPNLWAPKRPTAQDCIKENVSGPSVCLGPIGPWPVVVYRIGGRRPKLWRQQWGPFGALFYFDNTFRLQHFCHVKARSLRQLPELSHSRSGSLTMSTTLSGPTLPDRWCFQTHALHSSMQGEPFSSCFCPWNTEHGAIFRGISSYRSIQV